MKIQAKLGVAAEAGLKNPTACFRLSKSLTRIGDALAFGEYYLKNTKANKIAPRDFDHMSAAIFTSGRSAEDLSKLVSDARVKASIESYAKKALRFNVDLRKGISGREKEPLDRGEVARKAQSLRLDFKGIEQQVESLCMIEKTATAHVGRMGSAPPPTRVAMSGSALGPLRKRPIYPRFVVASMRRSRR